MSYAFATLQEILTPCFGRYQENKLARIRVEVIDLFLSIFIGHGAVEETDVIASIPEKKMEHLQQSHTVREDEDFVAIFIPELEKLLQYAPLRHSVSKSKPQIRG